MTGQTNSSRFALTNTQKALAACAVLVVALVAAGVLIFEANYSNGPPEWAVASNIANVYTGFGQVATAVIALIAVAVTVVSVARQIDVTNRQLAETARQTEVQRMTASLEQLNSFDTLWDSPQMRTSRGTVARALIDPAQTSDSTPILNFFEKMGIFMKEGGLAPRPAWGLFAEAAEAWRILLNDEIAAYTADDPTYYEGFNWVIQEFKRIDKERGVLLSPEKEHELAETVKLSERYADGLHSDPGMSDTTALSQPHPDAHPQT